MTLNIYCVSKRLECLYKIYYVNNNDRRFILITPGLQQCKKFV